MFIRTYPALPVPPRRIGGTPPRPPHVVVAHFAAPPEHWHLAVIPSWTRDGWVSLKLYAEGTADRKANYYLGWHKRDGRFSTRGDGPELRLLRPELHKAVRRALRELKEAVEWAALGLEYDDGRDLL